MVPDSDSLAAPERLSIVDVSTLQRAPKWMQRVLEGGRLRWLCADGIAWHDLVLSGIRQCAMLQFASLQHLEQSTSDQLHGLCSLSMLQTLDLSYNRAL